MTDPRAAQPGRSEPGISAAGRRLGTSPLDQQQRGVIAQAADLMLQHGPDQPALQFLGWLATGGLPLQRVGQPVQPEQLAVRSPSLDHAVGVQQFHMWMLVGVRAGQGRSRVLIARRSSMAR